MIYIIVGPTACGKTEVAKKLSDYYCAPIVNADAFQIYQDMNIGTAKIEKDDPYYAKHYLLDIVTPEQSYSVKDYQHDFRSVIVELKKKYKDIIVVGGTGLYIRASIYDYSFNDETQLDTSDLDEMSNEELWNLLLKLDPESTNNLHQNNRKRVIRAISILRSSGKSKSEIIASQEHKLIYDDVEVLFINPNREQLYENINKRVDEMFELGLVDEVKSLLNKYSLSITATQAIGYKEVIAYLNNELTLDECKELIKKRTRNYAKRQITFFKHQFACKIYDNKEQLINKLTHGGSINEEHL